MSTIATEPIIMADFNRAEFEAERIIEDLGIEHAPVNAIAVANRLGYKVVAANLKISGRMLLRGGKVEIEVNAFDPPNRRRFTIAHEIGHAILHTDGWLDLDVLDSSIDEQKIDNREIELAARQDHNGTRPTREAEADRFAAALLMPSRLVTASFRETPNTKVLAKLFEVSEQAMDIRLKQLQLHGT